MTVEVTSDISPAGVPVGAVVGGSVVGVLIIALCIIVIALIALCIKNRQQKKSQEFDDLELKEKPQEKNIYTKNWIKTINDCTWTFVIIH